MRKQKISILAHGYSSTCEIMVSLLQSLVVTCWPVRSTATAIRASRC